MLMPSLRLGAAAARVLGAATAFPADPVETGPLLQRLAGELPERRREALAAFVHEEIGVSSRAFVAPGQRAWHLAVQAARDALQQAGDPLVVAHLHASSTSSRWTGPDAARIGQALGLGAALADLRAGCTGGLWALVQGARLAADAGAAVLITAADAFSLVMPKAERMMPLAMGDGAAALVLGPGAPGEGLLGAVLGGAPEHADLATVPGELPPSEGAVWHLAGDPERFGEQTERALRAAVEALTAPPGLLHLVHARLAVARRVAGGQPLWRQSLADHGQLGAASLVVALAQVRAAGAGPELVLASAGGGLGFGAARWRLAEGPCA